MRKRISITKPPKNVMQHQDGRLSRSRNKSGGRLVSEDWRKDGTRRRQQVIYKSSSSELMPRTPVGKKEDGHVIKWFDEKGRRSGHDIVTHRDVLGLSIDRVSYVDKERRQDDDHRIIIAKKKR
ncbi:MAG: hypothetical protein NT067_00465 [Candidatus Diapherotrites archaeon]|nr:hypothetical protein [Candidatus Diapherotrites archaeon]